MDTFRNVLEQAIDLRKQFMSKFNQGIYIDIVRIMETGIRISYTPKEAVHE